MAPATSSGGREGRSRRRPLAAAGMASGAGMGSDSTGDAMLHMEVHDTVSDDRTLGAAHVAQIGVQGGFQLSGTHSRRGQTHHQFARQRSVLRKTTREGGGDDIIA